MSWGEGRGGGGGGGGEGRKDNRSAGGKGSITRAASTLLSA